MKIELTTEWSVELVVCTNLETLGIDANDSEILQEAMQVCASIFNSLSNSCWSFVREDSYFPNWNGGKYSKSGYCIGHFAFDFFARDIAEEIEEWESYGDQAYSEWYWVDLDSVPLILKIGLERILEECNEAIDTVLSAYRAKSEEIGQGQE